MEGGEGGGDWVRGKFDSDGADYAAACEGEFEKACFSVKGGGRCFVIDQTDN